MLNVQINAKEVTTDRIPEVIIQYAATYDDVCSTKYSYTIDSKWKRELVARLPGWRKLWNKDGSLLLKTSRQIARKPFQEQSFTVALSVCSFPSISMPLIVNSRYALKSFTNKPISDSVFISIIDLDYKRAWEIVNQNENYLFFIDELKSAPSILAVPQLEV